MKNLKLSNRPQNLAWKDPKVHEGLETQLRTRLTNLTGEKFGRLLVIKYIGVRKRMRYWQCLCDCGNTRELETAALTTENTKSCGCLQHNKGIPKPSLRKRPYEALYNGFVRGARREGREVSLTYEDFLHFTKQKFCTYCSAALIWSEYTSNNQAYYLDRKDNNRGYVLDNVVVSCSKCNRARGNRYSFEEWVVMTAALRKYRETL